MNKECKPKFIFISFISRSGSTLLCKMFDEYKGISVGIEAGFPGATHTLINKKYKSIGYASLLDDYLAELFNDIRFKAWGVDKSRLVLKLEERGYPLSFKDILECIFFEYFHGESGDILVHKSGYYIEVLDEVEKEFENFKNIFIIRDPRAIYSSQLKAPCLYTGRAMVGSLASFVYLYKKRATIAKEANIKQLLTIKYEDIVENSENVMSQVLKYIGMENSEKDKSASDYSEKIPANQKTLHINVNDAPNKKSLKKWVQQLNLYELRFIQKKLSSEMKVLGYEAVSLPIMGFSDFYSYVICDLKYKYLICRRYLDRWTSGDK